MSGLINQSSSHADEDIGAQPSVRFSRTKEQFDIQQDTEFFVVKQVESRNVFSAEGEEVANLRDISDINSTAISAGIGTNFILTYDATEDNFKFISPDALVDSLDPDCGARDHLAILIQYKSPHPQMCCLHIA